MRRASLEAALLLLLSALLGLGAALVRHPSIPLRLPASFFQLESGARPLLLGQVMALAHQGGSAFVDARGEADFLNGHLPGAICLPAGEWQELLPQAEEWLQGVPLVLYGSSGDVNTADNLAGVLSKEGFAPISVLVEGYEAWVRAGYPVDRTRAGLLREETEEEPQGSADDE